MIAPLPNPLCVVDNFWFFILDPTMILGNGKRISGEQSLADVAKEVGFKGFRQELETNLPPLLGSAACR